MSRRATFASAASLIALAAVLTVFGVGEEAEGLPDWQAFVLGIVQGLTELLPISSSGHLILVPWLGDWTYLEQHDAFNQTFDVALHLGTLVAVIAYFRRDIVELAVALAGSIARRRIRTPAERTAWVVAVAPRGMQPRILRCRVPRPVVHRPLHKLEEWLWNCG